MDDPRNPKAALALMSPEEKRAHYQAQMARLRARVAASSAELLQAGAGCRAVLLQSTRQMFRHTLISPDTYGRAETPWRSTDLLDGEPTGHELYRTKEDALQSHAGVWLNGPPFGTAFEFYAVRADRPRVVGQTAPRPTAPGLHLLLDQLARIAAPEFSPRTWVGAYPTWALVKPEHVEKLVAQRSAMMPPEQTLAAIQPFFERLVTEKMIEHNPIDSVRPGGPGRHVEAEGFPRLEPPVIAPPQSLAAPSLTLG